MMMMMRYGSGYGVFVCLQSFASARRRIRRRTTFPPISTTTITRPTSAIATVSTATAGRKRRLNPSLAGNSSLSSSSSLNLDKEHRDTASVRWREGKETEREEEETETGIEDNAEEEQREEAKKDGGGRGRGRELVEDGYGNSHTPVLLSEVLQAFHGRHLHSFVDCTLGAAGHATSIIREHPELKTFIGLDVDPKAHYLASLKLQNAIEEETGPELHVIATNFKHLKSTLHQLGLAEQGVDGILMDLGMSSMQVDEAERGFSLQQDGPLDMRMNPLSSLTAEDILNSWPEAEIGRIIRDYGEEKQWKRLARKISEVQLSGGIRSTSHLMQLIQDCIPLRFSPGRPGWKKTAARVFQALRIAVNDELSVLEGAIPDAFDCLASKGRLAVISFHSLEDRIVKQCFLKAIGDTVHRKSRYGREKHTISEFESEKDKEKGNRMLEGEHAIVITRKPLIAGEDEIKLNSRSRSAKLRVLEKK